MWTGLAVPSFPSLAEIISVWTERTDLNTDS